MKTTKHIRDCLIPSVYHVLYIGKNNAGDSYSPVNRWHILSAELALGTKFATDFLNCLMVLGGVKEKSLCQKGLYAGNCFDVVFVTKFVRSMLPNVPSDLYVVDYGVVEGDAENSSEMVYFLQNRSGEVYSYSVTGEVEKIADSYDSFLSIVFSDIKKKYGADIFYCLADANAPVQLELDRRRYFRVFCRKPTGKTRW